MLFILISPGTLEQVHIFARFYFSHSVSFRDALNPNEDRQVTEDLLCIVN